ncbi:MAG: hypothetical protein M5U28_12790 [Sandaracinaceae bacterium]|nr:hypothetical protein [Sandaracinaceae bacterium]
MEHKEHYLGPVLIGGVLAAILSSIPIVNYCNFIFCMWMLLGAGLAVKLVQDKTNAVQGKEGAVIGLFTGLVTGGLFGVLYLLMFLLFGAAMIPGAANGQLEGAALGTGMMAIIFGGSCILAVVIFGGFGASASARRRDLPAEAGDPAGRRLRSSGWRLRSASRRRLGPPPGGGYGPPPGGGFGQPPGGGFGQPPGGGFGQPPAAATAARPAARRSERRARAAPRGARLRARHGVRGGADALAPERRSRCPRASCSRDSAIKRPRAASRSTGTRWRSATAARGSTRASRSARSRPS